MTKKNFICLAFPGMGKTPTAKRGRNYLDLDFGNFREAFGVAKAEEAQLLEPFAKLAQIYQDQGWYVLTNEPKLAEFMHIDRMYLPTNLEFSARKMGVSEEQIAQWIEDWQMIAKVYQIPVIFVNKGLDDYLQ